MSHKNAEYIHCLYDKIMNKFGQMTECYICNIKMNIIMSSAKLFGINIKTVYYVCHDCFNIKIYVNLNDVINTDNCSLLNNIRIFRYGKKFYVLKTDICDTNKRNQRKIKLLNKLKDMKLNYVSGGICGEYINYGKHDINFVINELLKKQTSKYDRLYLLLNELRNKNLEYDDRIPSYQKYLKYGGELEKIINNGQIEKILIDETDFLEIKNDNDSEIAREIASVNFINSGKNNKIVNNYISKKNSIKFD